MLCCARIAWLISLIPATHVAQSGAFASLGTRPEEVDRLARAYQVANSVPGLALAIARGDTILHTASYGAADLEMAVPVTNRTLFRTASTLKPMTAAAVSRLALDGALDLDQPIERYCPAFPPKRTPVTARMLLAHISGIRASTVGDVFNRDHYATVGDALARFANDALTAEPGTREVYSNAGYTLLACAIEGASGEGYHNYLRVHVLDVARMTNTRRDNSLEVVPERARGYMVRTEENTRQWLGLWQPRHLADTRIGVPFVADPVDPSWAPGAGGYLTTPVDLVRFAAAMLAGRILPPKDVAQLTEPTRLASGTVVRRHLGWTIGELDDRPVLHVVGSDWNGSSAVWVRPSDGLAIAISTNKGFEQPLSLIEAVARAWR